MTVLDAPAGAHPASVLDRRTPDRARAHGLEYMRVVCVLAELVIAAHVVDALLHQGPASWILRAGWISLTIVLTALGVLSFLRLAQLSAALLAISLGTVATVEGLGISVAHTIKGAASGPDGTGLASAAAGVVLVALGAILVLGRARAWWRLVAIPIGLVYAAYLVRRWPWL